MTVTPFDATSILTTLPIAFIRNGESSGENQIVRFLRREVAARIVGVITVVAAQAIDLVANLLLIIVKAPLVYLQHRGVISLGVNFIPEALMQHLKRIPFNFLGIVGGMQLVIGDPTYACKLLSPSCANRWKWAESDMGLNRFFDMGGYISLDHCTDRQADMNEHMRKCHIQHVSKERGVNGKSDQDLFQSLVTLGLVPADTPKEEIAPLVKTFWSKFGNSVHSDNRKRGRMGCYMAHLLFFKKALESGKERIILMEDDCRFMKGDRKKLDRVHAELPEDWDILFLGYHNEQGYSNRPLEGKKSVVRANHALDTHCLILRKTALATVFEIMKSHLVNSNSVKSSDKFFAALQDGLDLSCEEPKPLATPMNIYAAARQIPSGDDYESDIDFLHRPAFLKANT